MRISGQTPVYRPAAQTRRVSSGSGSFGKQLDIAADRRTDQLEISAPGAARRDVHELELSPYCKLMDSYEAWKAKQPPKDLPDSWGPTEENLAYLKEHYSGDLSWEERVDALETMEQMGIITRDHKNEAMGSEMKVFKNFGKVMTVECITVKGQLPGISGNWDEYFQDCAISTFKTADDLFAWLDQILEKENA